MLQLLGGAALIGNAGRVTGPPGHRHPLALLALLAMTPSGAMSREKLMSLLWPESGQRIGRHSLNVAVHTLRRAFGEEVIRTVSGDLQLDRSLMPCDAADFLAALSRGDFRCAVDLYAGPFRDGFYVDGADDFERWQETERSHLALAYAGALGAMAEAAEQRADWPGAVDCWRRLATIEPGRSRVAVRLMSALERAGDRSGALAAADAHAELMTTEFNAEPDPEVVALATRIRNHPMAVSAPVRAPASRSPSSAPEPRPPVPSGDDRSIERREDVPPPRLRTAAPAERSRVALWLGGAAVILLLALALIAYGRNSLLSPRGVTPPLSASLAVLPFVNLTGDSTNDYLSDGLTEELLNALAAVRGLRVAARTSSFQFRSRGADVKDIGRRLDVSAVVEGSVRASGNRLRITAQLIDARTGYHLWSQEFDRPMADVFALQGDVALAVTTALRSTELASRFPRH